MNVLQFVVFMQFWQIKLPTLTTILLKNIKMLVLFEFFPTKELLAWIYDFLGIKRSDEEVAADELEGDGEDDIEEVSGLKRTGSTDLLENMGMMLIIGAVGLFVVIMIIVAFCLLKNNPTFIKLSTKVFDLIFYNAMIRYVLQSTLKVQIGAGSVIAQS